MHHEGVKPKTVEQRYVARTDEEAQAKYLLWGTTRGHWRETGYLSTVCWKFGFHNGRGFLDQVGN